jgi:hypothetical protein
LQLSLQDRALRGPGFAPVGGFSKQKAVGTVLGVGWGFVFDVGDSAFLTVAAEKFYFTVAVFAAKLGVVVDQCNGDGFYFPERLVTSAFFDAAAFDFTLVDLFAFDCH